MKAIVTVLGKDQVGIIAAVCTLLADNNVNVLDISQTILREFFTMTMLVDLSGQQAALHRAVHPAGDRGGQAGPGHQDPAGGHLQRHAQDLRVEGPECSAAMRS